MSDTIKAAISLTIVATCLAAFFLPDIRLISRFPFITSGSVPAKCKVKFFRVVIISISLAAIAMLVALLIA